MIEPEALGTCPHCGFRDDEPMLILYPRLEPDSGSTWSCRACGRDWTDAGNRHPAPSHGIGA